MTKKWTAPKLIVHGDMRRITLEPVKKGGSGDNLVPAMLTPWVSCQCN